MTAAEALRKVPWLAQLDARSLDTVAAQTDRVTFAPGKQLLAELEIGEDLYILVEGTAKVTVTAAGGERREVGALGAGDACGEISLLSGELHSATVTAQTSVTALRLDRDEFDQLVSRHPAVLNHFAHAMSRRVVETDAALDGLLEDATGTSHPERKLEGRSAAVVGAKSSVGRAWRELVVSRKRELPFLALSSFVATLAVVRGAAFGLAHAGVHLLDFLRGAYTLGIAAVFLSTATALVRFRFGLQRWIAIIYGVGFALILNELSVFLAFDTFYLDMNTRDPKLAFDVEALYRRDESIWAILLMVALLGQLAFLRPFYRRLGFILTSRIRAAFRRQAA